MEIIKIKFEYLKKALKSLEKILKEIEKIDKDSELFNIFRDSLIQRFEYTIDLFWKFLKIYFEFYKKIIIKSSFPTEILKFLLKEEFFSENEYQYLIKAVSDRNATSHIYKEEIADEIRKNIPNYYFVIKNIVDKIESDLINE